MNEFLDETDPLMDSDDEINVKQHNKLLEDLVTLDSKQPVKKPTRTEPTTQISEYNLVKSITGNKDSVKLYELTKPLKAKATHVKITKDVKKSDKKTKTLEKPLEKPQADKVRRTVGYEKAKEEISRWEPVVTSHRASTYLSFPLNYNTKVEINSKRDTNWKVKSELEKAIESVENEIKKPEIYEIESEIEAPLTLQEMIERRKEMAKLRRFQSYQEMKTRMQNKIKSKKYRRILRKERAKKEIKDFEKLQKENPEEALKKLDEIERTRAMERASLRHKSTGKWAKNQQIRAKFDKDSRQVLAEQLAISKELTKKKQEIESSESENEDNDGNNPGDGDLEFNFWLTRKIPDKNKDLNETNPVEQNITSKLNENLLENNENFKNLEEKIEINKDKEKKVKVNRKLLKENEKNKNFIGKSEKLNKKLIKTPKNFEIKEGKWDINKNKANEKIINKKLSKENERNKKFIGKNNITSKLNDFNKKLNVNELNYKNKDVECLENVQKKLKRKRKPSEDDEIIKKSKKLKLYGMSGDWAVDESFVDDLANKLEDKFKEKVLKKSVKLKQSLENFNKIPKKSQKLSKKLKNPNKNTKKPDLTLKKSIKTPIIDEPLQESTKTTSISINDNLNDLKTILDSTESKINIKNGEIEPNKYLKLTPANVESSKPDLYSTNDNENDSDLKGIIAEAFEDEDLIDDFSKDKQNEIDKDTPKDLDLFMPGWGSWGGTNIKSTSKRKRFIVKFPKDLPRNDKNRGDLIINENSSKAIKAHMVSDVPFPFKSAVDYEATIKAPIGNTFVPETAFRRLTKPGVTTKLGTIIEPVDEDVLMKKMKKFERVFKLKK